MKRHKLIAYLITFFIVAGCAQKRLPPPYQQDTDETARQISTPQVTDTTTPVAEHEQPDMEQDRRLGDESTEVDASELGPKASPFSAGFINDRISFYTEQLERLKKLDANSDITSLDPQQSRDLFNCSRDLQRLLDGYHGFHERLFRGTAGGDEPSSYANMIALQRLDIVYLNSSCAAMLEDGGSARPDSSQNAADSSLPQVAREIDEYFQAGAYDEVVQRWSQMPSYQHDRVDMKTAVQYADALMYRDQPDQSAEVYRQVIDRVDAAGGQTIDPLMVRKRLADLYTAAGNFFEAEKQYEQLIEAYEQVGNIEVWAKLQLSLLEQSMKGSPELTSYSQLLRAYLAYAPEKDGFSIVWKAEEFLQHYPYSPVTDNVDIIKTDTLSRADQWFARVITQADALAAEKQLQQAIELLQSIPADKLDPENQGRLEEKLDSLLLAEAVDRETIKIEKMQELQQIWNEGSALAESGDLEKAIEIFGHLIGTQYEDKAREKIGELALIASRIERRKAADLFVRSTKTDDMEDKKQLLSESRRVLKGILAQYPDVEVADKVRGNIRQVEKKMNEIDPTLLPEIEQQERDQQMTQVPVDDETNIEGFDVDPQTDASVDQPKKAVLPVYTPQNIQ